MAGDCGGPPGSGPAVWVARCAPCALADVGLGFTRACCAPAPSCTAAFSWAYLLPEFLPLAPGHGARAPEPPLECGKAAHDSRQHFSCVAMPGIGFFNAFSPAVTFTGGGTMASNGAPLSAAVGVNGEIANTPELGACRALGRGAPCGLSAHRLGSAAPGCSSAGLKGNARSWRAGPGAA